MQKFLIIKLIVIGILCLIFMIAMAMINGLVYERKAYESSVIDEIAQTQIGEQTLITPFLLQENNGKLSPIFANNSELIGNLSVKNNQYARGIYKAISYQNTLTIKQKYVFPQTNVPTTDSKGVSNPKNTTTLIIPVSDLRGVNLPTVSINNKSYQAKFADKPLPALGGSTNYLTILLDNSAIPTDIEFGLELSGLSGFGVVPLGDDVHLKLTGNWKEPKFYGNALPNQKTLNQTGFNAYWQNPFLAQQNSIALSNNFKNCDHCEISNLSSINTDFVNTNNVYTKTDRTIKYALILLLVSFGTFFLFEIIKGLKIHPIQYLLVASGLLTFYTLLLSLAELIAFYQAYFVASIACVGLIGWYSSFLLKSKVRALVFASILGSLYAGFYVILSVNEMNLLLGSVFCFVLLFVTMFITRKIDWYQLTDNKFSQKSIANINTCEPDPNQESMNQFIEQQGEQHDK